MYKLAIILLRDSINQSTENIRFLSYLIFSVYKFAITYLPRPLPPASYAVAHGYLWDAHFDKFAQKVKMWLLHRMMCKSMRMQALDTIVPFYAVLLASAQLLPYCPVLAHHYLPTHPPLHASWHAADVAGGAGWHGQDDSCHGFSSSAQYIRSEGCQPTLNPPLVTSSLSI